MFVSLLVSLSGEIKNGTLFEHQNSSFLAVLQKRGSKKGSKADIWPKCDNVTDWQKISQIVTHVTDVSIIQTVLLGLGLGTLDIKLRQCHCHNRRVWKRFSGSQMVGALCVRSLWLGRGCYFCGSQRWSQIEMSSKLRSLRGHSAPRV